MADQIKTCQRLLTNNGITPVTSDRLQLSGNWATNDTFLPLFSHIFVFLSYLKLFRFYSTMPAIK
jgi:hypothetical protein